MGYIDWALIGAVYCDCSGSFSVSLASVLFEMLIHARNGSHFIRELPIFCRDLNILIANVGHLLCLLGVAHPMRASGELQSCDCGLHKIMIAWSATGATWLSRPGARTIWPHKCL